MEISALFWVKSWGVDDFGALRVDGLVNDSLSKPTDRADEAAFSLVLLWRRRAPHQTQIQVGLRWEGDALPEPVSQVIDLAYEGHDSSGYFVIQVAQEFATPGLGRMRLEAAVVGEPGQPAWVEYDVVA